MTLIEDEEVRAAKKGHTEFSTYKYPMAKIDGTNNPTKLLKLEGKDCWTMIKNLILSDGDIDAGLAEITKVYNDALERVVQSGEVVAEYLYPEFSFYASSEEELAKQTADLALQAERIANK